jgi:propionate CoA-transferase
MVRLMEIDGEDLPLLPPSPIDVALLRGTTADEAGNITMEREALTSTTSRRRWRCATRAAW